MKREIKGRVAMLVSLLLIAGMAVGSVPTQAFAEFALYLPMDEGSGSTIYDQSGNGNNGTIYGASWATGVSGTALEFDGVGDYAEVHENTNLDGFDDFSISIWIKPATDLNSSTGRQDFYYKGPPVQWVTSYALNYDDVDGRLQFNLHSQSDWFSYASVRYETEFNAGQWYHIAVTYDGLSEVIMYVNGTPQGVDVGGDHGTVNGIVVDNPYNLRLGARTDDQYYFNGTIDELRIYSRQLSDEEILALYEEFVPSGAGAVSGKVTDFATGEGIADGTVSADGYSTATDSQGNYSLSVSEGTYTVTASAPGYESQTKSNIAVTAGATTTLDFSLDPITAPVFQSRGIYIWGFTLSLVDNESDRQRFFNFCEARGIKTIFLWAEKLTQGPGKYDKYKDFIAVAHSSGYNMQVHALFGDTTGSWTENHSEVNDRVAAVLNYNSTYPNYKFDGIHLDVEFDPDTYDWNPGDIDHPGDSDDYVGLLTGLKDYSPNGESMRSQGMALSIATEPWWSDSNHSQVKTLIEVSDLDYIVIMAYSDHVGGRDGIKNISKPQRKHANRIGKSFALALETQEMRDRKDTSKEEDKENVGRTFFEEGKAEFEDVIDKLRNLKGLAGFVVHFYESYVLWYMIDQSSISFNSSTYKPGDTVTATVKMRKADNLTSRIVRVGLSVRDPRNKVFPDESDPKQDTSKEVSFTATDREKTVSLSWVIPSDARLGQYDATIAAWDTDYNYFGDNNEKKEDRSKWIELDRWGWKDNVFEIQETKATTLRVHSSALQQNYPNPFNPQTTIEYDIDKDSHVTLKIYNLAGQLIKTLVDEYQTIGHYSIIWYGDNDVGQEVASGVYFYRIKAGDFVSTKKMVVLK